jgi:hypothetical protein
MKNKKNRAKYLILTLLVITNISFGQKNAQIDLTNWSVTIPEGFDGKPLKVEWPEIMNFENSEKLKHFMYNDTDDQSIVFYAYPSGTTTANSSFSRTELREQITPGKDSENWTFAKGGRMKGTLRMGKISEDEKGKHPKVIVMQIHGRLTDSQRDLIGQKDNNAPPMLKIYWNNGSIIVKTKMLKDPNVSDKDILLTDSWIDDKGFTFKEKVDFDKFTIEILVSDGRMEVILNNKESIVYDSLNIKKWGIFENYFKAGNYFQSHEKNSFARVKYYSLEVIH